MKKIINILKFCVRKILLTTSWGRKFYSRRKALQHQAVLDAVQKYGEEIINRVFELCEKRKIPAMLFFGTLLGCVRDGGIMKHDDDIDIAVLPNNGLDLLQMVEDFVNAGFQFFWAWECEGHITEIAFTYKSVHVDFYFMQEKSGFLTSHWYTPIEGVKYPTKKYWSAIECSSPLINKIASFRPETFTSNVAIPENYDDVLSYSYGEWRVPDPNWKSGAGAVAEKRSSRKLLEEFGRMMNIEELKEFLK